MLARDVTETERRVAWLRLLAIPILAVGQTLPHPDPEQTGFFVTLGVFAAVGIGILLLVYRRRVGQWFALATTAFDVGAFTTLALLSGGAFSSAGSAFFLIPLAVAFRFRPSLTALVSAATVAAYLAQALLHPSASGPEATRLIAVRAGYLAWIGFAAVLLSHVIERRTTRVAQLAAARQRLMVDAILSEEHMRRNLAEGLHDHAIQTLLSTRHELQEAAETSSHPALARADDALRETVAELREAVYELHPFVLDEAGLETALRAAAARSARHGGFEVSLDLRHPGRHPHERLLFSAARQLLANVVQHASARHVVVCLDEEDRELVLLVKDDGNGFEPASLPDRVAQGHIGLASQRERIESVGGVLRVLSTPGKGTSVEVRVPI